MKNPIKRVVALAALAGFSALLVFAQPAAAQTGTLTADPATVPAEGEHTFTVNGSGFTAGLALFVLPCTIPGPDLSISSPAADVAAALAVMAEREPTEICDLSSLTPAVVGEDGTFSVQVKATVGTNFAWGAGDAAGTETGAVPVFVADPSDMDSGASPDGAVSAGFGGMATDASGDSSVAAAALVAGLSLLAGAALVIRRRHA